MPDGIICSQSQKPPLRHVAIQEFQQELFAAQPVDGLQQQRPQQLLWRQGRTTRRGVQLSKRPVQTLQCPMGQ